jgi:hypothetical protein
MGLRSRYLLVAMLVRAIFSVIGKRLFYPKIVWANPIRVTGR